MTRVATFSRVLFGHHLLGFSRSRLVRGVHGFRVFASNPKLALNLVFRALSRIRGRRLERDPIAEVLEGSGVGLNPKMHRSTGLA